MMKYCLQRLIAACFLTASYIALAQSSPAPQSIPLQGLRASAGHGGFRSAAWLPDGSLVLLEDRADGLRLLKTNSTATTLLAQEQLGGPGDSGIAMSVDASGNIYITGTSGGNGSLTGTGGAAFPSRADSSTNGFLAKFDATLHPLFVTFLGSGRTAPTAIAVAGNAVYVTGSTYSTSLPVTGSAIGQSPASGSSGNGFVESFDGSSGTLRYATYVTGYGGDTAPAGIAANNAGNAFVVGLTAASGFPTTRALEPEMLGTTSGFLAELSPGGDGYVFSTFVTGSGLSSVATDAKGALLVSGNVAFGGFPVSSVSAPLADTVYQSLLRMPADGQSVTSALALVPGTLSRVAASPDGGAWISGSGGALPLFPATALPLATQGDAFLLHVSSANIIDRSVRLGALPVSHAAFASVSTAPGPPAVTGDGNLVAEAATLTANVAASLVSTQHFDLPLIDAPNSVLNATAHDLLHACSSGQCSGGGGILTMVSVNGGASLALSSDDAPNLRATDLGSADAQGITVTVNGFTESNNCGSALSSGSPCNITLSGNGPGTVTVSAANSNTASDSLGPYTRVADPIAISVSELDYGVIPSGTSVGRTLTLTNFTSSPQTITVTSDGLVSGSYAVTPSSSDCTQMAPTAFQVPAGSACHLVLTITTLSSVGNSTFATNWLVGTRDVLLTGATQAGALSLSSSELDFGVQFAGQTSLRLPHYLFLSNNGSVAVAHAAVTLPASSPFSVKDGCAESIPAGSVCRIEFNYESAAAPTKDTSTVALDEGLSVLLSGETLPQAAATGATANPSLSVSPAEVEFPTAVPVTGVAAPAQPITVRNTGAGAMPIGVAVSGDFTADNECPSVLAGGTSCVVLAGFTPTAPGVREGVLSITGGSGFAPTYVTLNGTGSAILPANNGVLDLGETYVGEPLFTWYKVQQSFPTLTASVSGAGFAVAIVEDTGSGHGTPALTTLSASATSTCTNCWVGIAYTPAGSGTSTGTLLLTSAGGGKPYTLELDASALPVTGVVIDSQSSDFGAVVVGSTSATQTISLTDLLPSSASLTISSVEASGDFAITANNTGGASCTGVLSSTSSCFVSVRFTPKAAGQRTGTLRFATDQGIFISGLTGSGTADTGILIAPSTLVFANTNDGSASTQSATVTNTSSATLSVGTILSSSSAFAVTQSGSTLSPGDVLTVQVRFTPQPFPVSGTLTIPVIRTINGQPIPAVYTLPVLSTYAAAAAGLVILPAQANFGLTSAGSMGLTRQFTLANFTPHRLAVSFTSPRQFPMAGPPTACATLAAGASCVFSVAFAPSVSGEATGTVTATGSATDGNATLQALGYMIGYAPGSGTLNFTAPGIIPDTPLSFGLVTSGQSKTLPITLTNTSANTETIRRVVSSPPFFATTTCGTPLASGASCTATVVYAPVNETATNSVVPRRDQGTLSIESDAAASPLLIQLAGSVQPVTASTNAGGSTLNTYQLSTSALTFSNTAIGNASSPQTVTLTNTGNTTLHIGAVLGTPDFQASTDCAALTAGSSCNLSVVFAPSSQNSAAMRTGTLEIQSDANDALEFLTVVGPSSPSPLQFSATSLDFGTVLVVSSARLPLTVTNATAAPVTFTNLSASGDYSVGTGTCPASGATLPAGSSCSLFVTFAPQIAGTRTGTLSLASDATQLPLTASLTGIGAAGKLTASPSALAFGPIAVGAVSNLTLTLTNSGTATLAGLAASVQGPGAANFTVTVPCAAAVLPPGASCTVTVQFAPASSSAVSAVLSIASSDPASPLLIPLTGSGAQGGGLTLTVDGGPSSSQTVKSGSPASYALLVTPTGGFTGAVALTCTAVNPAQYGTCSISPSTLTFTGAAAQSSAATINTLTSLAVRSGAWMALMLLPLWRRPRKRSRASALLLLAATLGLAAMLGACGGSSSPNNLRYSPPGTYQYTVKASSTSGPAISASVTLNLTVQ